MYELMLSALSTSERDHRPSASSSRRSSRRVEFELELDEDEEVARLELS